MLYVETVLVLYIFCSIYVLFSFPSFLYAYRSTKSTGKYSTVGLCHMWLFVLKFQETWQGTKFYEHKAMILIEDIQLCFSYDNKTNTLLRQNVIKYLFYCDKAMSIQGLHFQLFWYSVLYPCVID